MNQRQSFREPIPEIFRAAELLQKAVKKHLEGKYDEVNELLKQADNLNIKEWVESVIGKKSPYIQYREIVGGHPILSRERRVAIRMPNTYEKRKIHERDGHQCRFCTTPVIRKEVREKIIKQYPESVQWGKTNASRHAGFFAMWAQYDHIIPHARGGDNSLDNLVLTCTACNFGRMNYTLEEVGVLFPLEYQTPIIPHWNGLEEFIS